jgi:hypothetical protein
LATRASASGSSVTPRGLSVYANRYDDDQLFNNVMAVWESLGRRPNCRDMKNAPSRISATAYVARFGTWRKGLLAFLKWVEAERSDTSLIGTAPCDSSAKRMQEITSRQANIRHDHELRLPPGQRDRLRVAGPKLRFRVMQRDHFRCCFCGRSQREEVLLHIDHIVPWSDGGRTIFENLQTLCRLCNAGKGNALEVT